MVYYGGLVIYTYYQMGVTTEHFMITWLSGLKIVYNIFV